MSRRALRSCIQRYAWILGPTLAIAIAIPLARTSNGWGRAHAADDGSGSDGWIAAPVCHDGVWEPGEFCGRDCFLVTGTTDMNHDCVVDWLDLGLFFEDHGSVGAGFSGDLDGNGFVDNGDLATLASHLGDTVTPCVRGPLGKDACQGTLALSFNADPNNIDPDLVLAAPGFVPVYVVADGITDATIIEYSLRVTGSATLLSTIPGSTGCTNAATKQYFSTYSFGAPSGGPVALGSFLLNVTALTPVTLELRPFTAPCANGGSRLRWTDTSYNRSIDFAVLGNAAINGAVPAGAPSCATPVIASVTDIGNDQGRQVRVTASGSLFDAAGSVYPVVQYETFRRIDAIAKAEATSSFETRARLAAQQGMVSNPSILVAGWDYVGAAPAHQEATYNLVVPTLVDSTITDGMAYSVFFVRAATADAGRYFDSSPDSGYSRDNLPPSAPVAFHVSGVTGSDVTLSWDENLETDLRHYTLYRGTDPDFVPGVSNRIAHSTQTTFVNVGAAVSPYFYKVSASDFAGNESAFTLAHLEVSDVDPTGDLPQILSFRSGTMNPVRESALLLYDLPTPAVVTLHIYDARGRLVRSVLDRAGLSPGRYRWEWDLRDAFGVRVGQGVYFHRFTAGNSALTVKTVVIQ